MAGNVMIRRLVLMLVVGVTALSACGSRAGDDAQLSIVASTSILGDVVANVVGDRAEVEVLMPLGADPHDFQPSAAQVAAVNAADLVVVNGLGLEEGLEDVVDSAAGDGVRVLAVAPLVDPIAFAVGLGGEHADEHEGESLDPHVWLDPLRMAAASHLIAAELTEVDPSVDWPAAAEDYALRLTAADAEITEVLSAIPSINRRLVTNHASLGYFADRYDFEVIGTVIPAGSTLGDPSSQELAGLIEVMTDVGATVVFADTTRPGDLAEAVAAEIGGEAHVVELYTGSLGERGSGAETLIELLITNAERVAAALTG